MTLSPEPCAVDRRQKWIRRTIGSLLISVGLLGYFAGYRPAAARLAQLQSEISNHQIAIHQIELQASEFRKMQSDVDRVVARVGPTLRMVPTKTDLPVFIKEIGQVCRQSAVRKFECQPGAVRKLDELSEQKILLMFEGDFFNVFQFLKQAEELPQPIRLQSLSIKTRDAKLGQVEVRLAMNLYSAE